MLGRDTPRVKLRDLRGLYWSSCPDTEALAELAARGLALVVDLTEGECSYELPPGVEKLEYPIPDFSYVAFEGVLVDVALPVLRRLERGEKVLVHCRGGVGRSGVTVAMILGLRDGLSAGEARSRLSRLGFVGEVPSQALAFRWFFRARDLVGARWIEAAVGLMRSVGRGRASYWGQLADHASTVAGIALDVLEAVSDRFGVSRSDMVSAYAAGLLHDVGRVLGSEEDHHAVGAVRAAELCGALGGCDARVVYKAVFHHRWWTDLLGDEELRSLGFAAQLVAAAVRLADAVPNAYEGEGVYSGVKLGGSELVVYLDGSVCYQLEERLRMKSLAFSELSGLEVRAQAV